MLNLLRSSLVERCRDSVKKTERLILEEGTRGVLESWTMLLWELAEDFSEAERHILHLQARIKMKERIHEEDWESFEDLQNQLQEEHRQEMEKEKRRHRKEVDTLKKDLLAKEGELDKAMEIKNELLDRINTIFKKKNSIRLHKAALLKEKETLIDELRKQKEMIDDLQDELRVTKKILAEESERCFQEGIRVGRKMAAIEEMGVLEELEMLKEIEYALVGNMRRSDSEITLKTSLDDLV